MRRFELIAPCHFGMESVLKREITDLGYDITEVADGRVTFSEMRMLCAEQIFFCGRQKESLSKSEVFMRRLLKNCFRARKIFPGKNTFRRTANSGWPRQLV